jgi:RimJ/RimL family protein N-acetyltransferase
MTITPRLAQEQDALAIWEWRNDHLTRENSLRTEPIAWEDHCAWLHRQLADPDIRLYVLEDRTYGAVAQVRYERQCDSLAEVHITVAPAVRGRGVGTQALRMTLPLALRSLQVRRVTARIKKGNEASLRAFLRSGFIVEHERVCGGSQCFVLSFENKVEPVLQP